MIIATFFNMPLKWKEYNELDKECKMTLSEFKQLIKVGAITPDDGHGYYATDTEVSNMYIFFDDVIDGDVDEFITHVCWYNK